MESIFFQNCYWRLQFWQSHNLCFYIVKNRIFGVFCVYQLVENRVFAFMCLPIGLNSVLNVFVPKKNKKGVRAFSGL